MTAKRFNGFSHFDSERSEHLTAKRFDCEQSEHLTAKRYDGFSHFDSEAL